MHDLVIRHGTVVDGLGGEPYVADVAVDGDRIVAIGPKLPAGTQEIDATGCVVTPGFVELHTHYDGQATWDDQLAPSTWHGVTTAVMGNCGVGFAPVRPNHHQRLIELMEGVEDIPGTALHEGLKWNWETLPEYMDLLDRLPHAADLLVQVPHDTVRTYVLGDRASAEAVATPEEIAQMVAMAREAMEAGAVGISTGRSDNHRTSKGAFTPASEASVAELTALAGALKGLDHGVLQGVSDFDMNQGAEHFEREFDVLEAMVAASGGHPMSYTLLQRDMAPDQWQKILRRTEAARDKGLDVHVQVAARPIGVLLGLEATFHPFIGKPSFQAIAHLPLAERVAAMKDPARKAAILAEEHQPVAGDDSSLPRFVDDFLEKIVFLTLRMFRLGSPPNYEPPAEASLYMESDAKGVDVMDLLYDCLLEDDGHALLYFPLFNYSQMNLDDLHGMLTHPAALLGLSDSGAHVGTVCDASFPTTLLTHWVRDRDRGERIPLPRAIRMLTHDTAAYLGLTDRGQVTVGKRADLNVIDLDRLRLLPPRVAYDLPAGGRRLMQDADGYRATILRGQVIRANRQFTDARPGRLVRMGQPLDA